MKNNKLIYILIIILCIWCISLTAIIATRNEQKIEEVINQYNVTGFSTDFTKIVEEKQSSIVTISAGGTTSSGFVYKQDGETVYIITSYHGIADADSAYVYFENGVNTNASIIEKNKYVDIAVLSVKTPYDIEPLVLADADMVNSGEFVICIGTPASIEYSNSVEIGMISNNIRTIENNIIVNDENIVYYLDVLQLSSNLKAGYSGGPVLNMNGDVIGIVTMSLDDRFNFAVTANEVKIIADKIINNENVVKYQLGIKGTYVKDMPLYERTNLDLPVDITYGLYVNKLMDYSVGLVAGIKNNDVILEINGIKMNNINDYLKSVYTEANSIEFKLFRSGEIITCKVDIND